MLFDPSETRLYQEAFERAFGDVAALVNDPVRTGVYCSIADDRGLVLVSFNVAEPQLQNAARYYQFAGEKAARLGRHANHLTSGQSADEAAQQYPGAFRTAPFGEPHGKIISISGLPTGSADLSLGLLGCSYLDIVSLDYADLIVELDGESPTWEILRQTLIG